MNVNNIVLSIEEILEDENESQTNLEKYEKEYLKQRNIDRSERFKQNFMENILDVSLFKIIKIGSIFQISDQYLREHYDN